MDKGAACAVDGFDLAEWLVRNGYSLDLPQRRAARR
jgi:endonuclease YncB( thermonuclease family)